MVVRARMRADQKRQSSASRPSCSAWKVEVLDVELFVFKKVSFSIYTLSDHARYLSKTIQNVSCTSIARLRKLNCPYNTTINVRVNN